MFGHDLQVLLVKLKQILQLKVGCSDFGLVRDKDSLPYLAELKRYVYLTIHG